MTNGADRLLSDLTMTVKFYADRGESDPALADLVVVAEQMLETLSCLRRNQVMRAALGARNTHLGAKVSEPSVVN
ncbi:MAG: hypothetical protein AAF292_12325 [Pseudomonadota bacterium]